MVQLITTPWIVALVALLAVGAAGFPIARALLNGARGPAFEGRPESVVVLPYHTAMSSDLERELAIEVAGLTTRELNRWESIRAVRSVSMSGPMFDLGIAGPTLATADEGIELARALGSQGLVAVTIEVRGDSVLADAELFDAGTGRSVSRPVVAAVEAGQHNDLAIAIAYAILGLGDVPAERGDLRSISAHPDALAHDLDGTHCLERWRLAEAERSFREAIALDSTFALALHHLAQTLYWQDTEGSNTTDDVEAEIAQLSTAALQHSSGLPSRDSLHIVAFFSFQDGGYEGYADARSIYERLLDSDSTDVYAWLMLGSVEWADRWLQQLPDGAMLPRANLNVAQSAFVRAVTLQPRFSLGYGHLGDMYREIASAARRGGCTAYELPRADLYVEWDFPNPENMLSFCPTVLDSITWLQADTFFALPDSMKIVASDRLMDQWNRLVRRWVAYEPNERKPLLELSSSFLWQRRRLGLAVPETIDRLADSALDYASRALVLKRDTLPSDLAHLGSLYLAAGDLETAIALSDAAVDALGLENAPDYTANVYLASGQPSKALPIVSAVTQRWYQRDPESEGLLSYGERETNVDRIRALAATGVGGEPLEQELSEIRSVWWGSGYTARQRDMLRRDAVMRVAIMSGVDHGALLDFASGLEWAEPFWRVLLQDDPRAVTPTQLREMVVTEVVGLRETSKAFLLGLMASRAGEHALAAELFSRLDSLPSRTNQIDFSWGLRSLSYLLRAEAYQEMGEEERAREWEGRWEVWRGVRAESGNN